MAEAMNTMKMDAYQFGRFCDWLDTLQGQVWRRGTLRDYFAEACRESESKRARVEPRVGPDANEAARARGDCESVLAD